MKINLLGKSTKIQKQIYTQHAKTIIKKIENRIPQICRALNIILVDNCYIKRLNKQFLNRNYATDVLAFPLCEKMTAKISRNKEKNKNLRKSDIDSTSKKSDILWGEIYISYEQARKQARFQKITTDQEICHLIAHGILHLAGYSHHQMQKILNSLPK
ncbi:MAG: rRNA maturation RNase YbeY [candidate division WOR-3 bacterium]